MKLTFDPSERGELLAPNDRRYLVDHELDLGANSLTIQAMDVPGSGGAHHLYRIGTGEDCFNSILGSIPFQAGPVAEVGVNGVTDTAVLAVLIDRLRSFQAGPYSCRENALALTKLEEGLMWMHQRTRNRLARGVEGTSSK